MERAAIRRAEPGARVFIRRAHAVHPVTAGQPEYSLWTRGIEDREGDFRRGNPPGSSPRVTASPPTPDTKRVARVEENTAADGLQPPADVLAKLSGLPPAAGGRHTEAGLRTLER
ncbi:hypothetical protein OHQ89_14425 [Streptomyces canus]|uniref:hypothetical protein n=1 Tax=Streptomyces canus TaxID=58343 RepID=UPI002E293C02|nr:hypothetical protein [Streptomyces canus]